MRREVAELREARAADAARCAAAEQAARAAEERAEALAERAAADAERLAAAQDEVRELETAVVSLLTEQQQQQQQPQQQQQQQQQPPLPQRPGSASGRRWGGGAQGGEQPAPARRQSSRGVAAATPLPPGEGPPTPPELQPGTDATLSSATVSTAERSAAAPAAAPPAPSTPVRWAGAGRVATPPSDARLRWTGSGRSSPGPLRRGADSGAAPPPAATLGSEALWGDRCASEWKGAHAAARACDEREELRGAAAALEQELAAVRGAFEGLAAALQDPGAECESPRSAAEDTRGCESPAPAPEAAPAAAAAEAEARARELSAQNRALRDLLERGGGGAPGSAETQYPPSVPCPRLADADSAPLLPPPAGPAALAGLRHLAYKLQEWYDEKPGDVIDELVENLRFPPGRGGGLAAVSRLVGALGGAAQGGGLRNAVEAMVLRQWTQRPCDLDRDLGFEDVPGTREEDWAERDAYERAHSRWGWDDGDGRNGSIAVAVAAALRDQGPAGTGAGWSAAVLRRWAKWVCTLCAAGLSSATTGGEVPVLLLHFRGGVAPAADGVTCCVCPPPAAPAAGPPPAPAPPGCWLPIAARPPVLARGLDDISPYTGVVWLPPMLTLHFPRGMQQGMGVTADPFGQDGPWAGLEGLLHRVAVDAASAAARAAAHCAAYPAPSPTPRVHYWRSRLEQDNELLSLRVAALEEEAAGHFARMQIAASCARSLSSIGGGGEGRCAGCRAARHLAAQISAATARGPQKICGGRNVSPQRRTRHRRSVSPSPCAAAAAGCAEALELLRGASPAARATGLGLLRAADPVRRLAAARDAAVARAAEAELRAATAERRAEEAEQRGGEGEAKAAEQRAERAAAETAQLRGELSQLRGQLAAAASRAAAAAAQRDTAAAEIERLRRSNREGAHSRAQGAGGLSPPPPAAPCGPSGSDSGCELLERIARLEAEKAEVERERDELREIEAEHAALGQDTLDLREAERREWGTALQRHRLAAAQALESAAVRLLRRRRFGVLRRYALRAPRARPPAAAPPPPRRICCSAAAAGALQRAAEGALRRAAYARWAALAARPPAAPALPAAPAPDAAAAADAAAVSPAAAAQAALEARVQEQAGRIAELEAELQAATELCDELERELARATGVPAADTG
eukprot:TRINITY_DN12132_c0_g1_i2.p1 TRINITY_DN12132_c0_g1~~TRINITY_DN12132_c0_g1_i2.p1  ORF type:complete len:1177 (+),score=359.27 TRINITY_DN12132_c0_g1_i2:82-3531(+)